MSKLYLNDLESIKNGKTVRFNENIKGDYSSLISLSKIQNEINETRNIRLEILKKFRDDVNKELEWQRGSRIDNPNQISISPNQLFLKNYIALYIPTILGDSLCLFDENKLISSSGFGKDLDEKVAIIRPYIKKLFEIKKHSHILNNEFYLEYPVLDNDNNVVFTINGDGVLLPFTNYKDLSNEQLQSILYYFYTNHKSILDNVLIPNEDRLDYYRLDINKEKVLSIYKGL